MDSLFDDVARQLAQPQRRRKTLRVIFGSAAGGALVAFFPLKALAWGTVQCGSKTCPSGQICCNSTTESCCASSQCLKDVKGAQVCCPDGNACGGLCCASPLMCCSCGGVSLCCAETEQCSTATGVAVCERITLPQMTLTPTATATLAPTLTPTPTVTPTATPTSTPTPLPVCVPPCNPGDVCDATGNCVCDDMMCTALGGTCFNGHCVVLPA